MEQTAQTERGRGVMYSIPVRAMPKYRPRLAGGDGRSGHAYNLKRYRDWKEQTAWAIMAVVKGQSFPLTTDCALTLRIAYCKHGAGDIDNLAGGFMDAANHVLWDDDRRVRELHVYLDRHTGKPDSISFHLKRKDISVKAD